MCWVLQIILKIFSKNTMFQKSSCTFMLMLPERTSSAASIKWPRREKVEKFGRLDCFWIVLPQSLHSAPGLIVWATGTVEVWNLRTQSGAVFCKWCKMGHNCAKLCVWNYAVFSSTKGIKVRNVCWAQKWQMGKSVKWPGHTVSSQFTIGTQWVHNGHTVNIQWVKRMQNIVENLKGNRENGM